MIASVEAHGSALANTALRKDPEGRSILSQGYKNRPKDRLP